MLKTLAANALVGRLALAYQCCKHGGPRIFLHFHHQTQQSVPVLQQLGVRVWTAVPRRRRSELFSIAAPLHKWSFSRLGSLKFAAVDVSKKWAGRKRPEEMESERLRQHLTRSRLLGIKIKLAKYDYIDLFSITFCTECFHYFFNDI